MNKQSDQQQTNPEVESAAEQAVDLGGDIKSAVRDITMQALSKGKLDTDQIRGVVSSVVAGVTRGAEKTENSSHGSVRDALSGLDEALASSVQASRLAIEEAAGQVGALGSNEFKRAMDDLGALEGLFLNTIKEVAASTETRLKATLTDFVDHAKISGTAVGKAAAQAVALLTKQLGSLLLEVAGEGADAALRAGAQLSEVAAGLLEGISDSLKARSEKGKEKPET
ncbi:MAG: hypothetical protein KUG52_02725 [Immundisolibacteraceae bacterium]|nr:hypothetical protein [Immundisolibacteraceae bacterium]